MSVADSSTIPEVAAAVAEAVVAETPAKKQKVDLPAGRRLNVSTIAEPYRLAIRTAIADKYMEKPPKLVGFLANDDPGARAYARWTGKACAADNIHFELRECSVSDLEEKLDQANKDDDVTGIMIYYPVFGSKPSFYGGSMDEYLRSCVDPSKDVEGLCHTFRFALYRNERFLDSTKTKKCILPCTPLSIVKILEHLGLCGDNKMEGTTVTIINRSEVVGHPLAAMLANDGANVFSVDIDSIYEFKKVNGRGRLLDTQETAESACKQSNVIVTGVPSKSYSLNLDWVPEGCVVINVSPFKCVTSVDDLLAKRGVVYVPLVGKLTVAMLERNLFRLYEHRL